MENIKGAARMHIGMHACAANSETEFRNYTWTGQDLQIKIASHARGVGHEELAVRYAVEFGRGRPGSCDPMMSTGLFCSVVMSADSSADDSTE